jgi:8-oxo-dGTP pyrophosphatase MutT (NUDIX family)
LTDALQRECREELGSSVVIHDLLFVREYIANNHEFFADWAHDVHQVDFIFSCDIDDQYDPTLAPKHLDGVPHAVSWKKLDELTKLRFHPRPLLEILRLEKQPPRLHYLGDIP